MLDHPAMKKQVGTTRRNEQYGLRVCLLYMLKQKESLKVSL